MTNSKSILIIGYGNTLRGDDGVGFRLAEFIDSQRWDNVCVLAVHQLTPELAANIAKAKAVIFIDAAVSENNNIEVKILQPDDNYTQVAHYQHPSSLLNLSKSVYNFVPPAWWILIPGNQFDFGENFSSITQECFPKAINIIKELIVNIAELTLEKKKETYTV